MRGNRVRRPLPWLLLALLTLLPAITLGACQMPGSSSGAAPAAGASSSEEAERTRAMEEKAAEIERRAEEIRNMEGTEQEKIDAVNALDEERRELQRMQEGGSTP
jgi:hypothetical protein